VSAERPTQAERLQSQLVKMERELGHLRLLDTAMRERLARAVVETDEAKKTVAAQATMLADLRNQLGKQELELQLLRAEVASQPKPAAPVKVEEKEPPTRFGLLEVD
jgi:predicted  nucleic acid-binding Zn-ribbon protein